MRFLNRISQLFLLLLLVIGANAQVSISSLDKAYGLDPLLYNGKRYSYFPPPETKGTQFFNGPEAVSGTLYIRGKSFDQIQLKYDVFNQQIILLYKNNLGNENQLVVSDAWLEAFDLNDKHFELIALEDTTKNIYQVLGRGDKRALYAWHKNVFLDTRYGATNHIFAKATKLMYLYDGKTQLKYKNNRSFTKLFRKDDQPELRKFMRKNHIDVKKGDDPQIIQLLKFCNTLRQ